MDIERLIRRIWIGLFFGLLVLVGFGAWGDFSALRNSLSELKWEYLLLMVSFTLVGYVFRFAKWQLYLHHLNIHLSIKESAVIFLSGFSMSITPGKAGEVLKSFLLKRIHGIEISRTAPIVLAERVTDLLAMAILASIGISRFSYGGYLLLGTLGFLGLLILVIQSKSWTLSILHRIQSIPKLTKIGGKVEIFYESSFSLFRWKLLSAATLLSLVSWFLECASLFWVFQGLGMSLSLLDAIFSFSFSSIAGALSMLPGGLGAAETSMVGILMGLDSDRADAVTATLLARFGTLWFGVLLGLVTLVYSSRYFLRMKEKTR